MINAILFANWAIRIPDIKSHLQISEAELGLALLAAPIGILIFTPFTSIGIHKFGSGRISVISTAIMCFAIIFLALPQTLFQLILAIFLFGAASGTMDIR